MTIGVVGVHSSKSEEVQSHRMVKRRCNLVTEVPLAFSSFIAKFSGHKCCENLDIRFSSDDRLVKTSCELVGSLPLNQVTTLKSLVEVKI